MWSGVLPVVLEVGLDVFTFLTSLREDGRCVSCVAERDGLTRRAPQPGLQHESSSPSVGDQLMVLELMVCSRPPAALVGPTLGGLCYPVISAM